MKFFEKIKYSKILKEVNKLSNKFENMSNDELKRYSKDLQDRAKNGESLDSLRNEAFALTREASWRVLKKRPYDVQIIGSAVLHEGHIAELNTGEGKSLTSIMPAYLNALSGHGVHIITVNDYLAKRDAEEMGKVHKFLGMTVSHVHSEMNNSMKKIAYQSDIVYGTNSEFGFDYLRDNMVSNKDSKVQRGLNYCIIDEADSILIDEARTPLIISAASENTSDIYSIADAAVKNLVRGEDEKDMTKFEKMEYAEIEDTEEEIEKRKDFQVNEKYSTINLSDKGIAKIEKALGIDNLGGPENTLLYHHVLQAIRARHLMKKNIDYVISDGEVLIVDASTGRTMEGRRFSDGLHQALEAKEGVEIKGENQTSATITLQNYFRLYDKISGMTGTAKTEEQEFKDIYGMKVVEVPTNKPVIRKDLEDVLYLTSEEKEHAVYILANTARKKGQPVLIGTPSIEASESLSRYLNKKHLKHELLNAKSTFNQSISSATKEALIIAQAGKSGKVTIATNMAGRGTDILLGGNPEHLAVQRMFDAGFSEETINEARNFLPTEDEDLKKAQEKYQWFLDKETENCEKDKEKVLEAGGLFVIGTERHDSRRIDNQLKGRAGRQGDPGKSQFVLSLDDKLFRVYGGPLTSKLKERLKNEEPGEALSEGGVMGKAINASQKNIESQGFQQRKSILEFDEIDNVQRNEVYTLRDKILNDENIEEEFNLFYDYGKEYIENMSVQEIEMDDKLAPVVEELVNNSNNKGEVVDKFIKELFDNLKELGLIEKQINELKSKAMLLAVDMKWKNQIIKLQNLKESSRMSSFSQIEPIEIYKREASESFYEFKYLVGKEMITLLMSMNLVYQ